MKKLLEEFKAFALRGNVLDMAVGVIVAGLFTGIVGALTENIINPLIACLGGTEVGLVTKLGNTGQVLNWGAVITAIINFIITAFVLFMILKAANKMKDAVAKKEEPAPEPEPKKSDELLALEQIVELLKKEK